MRLFAVRVFRCSAAALLLCAALPAESAARSRRPRPPRAAPVPKTPQELAQAAQDRFSAERWDEAIELWLQADAIAHAPILIYNIGNAHRRARRDREACDAYTRFLKEARQDDELRGRAEVWLGECQANLEAGRATQLLARKDYEGAARTFESAYRIGSNAAFLYQAAEALVLGGRDEQALDVLQRFLQRPSSPALKAQADEQAAALRARIEARRAERLFSGGQYELAADAWALAGRHKADPVYPLQAGIALVRAGKHREGERRLVRWLQDHGHGHGDHVRRSDAEAALGDARALIEDERAAQLLRGGKAAEAAGAWQDAWSIRPRPEFLYRQARARRAAGEAQGSLALLDQLLSQRGLPEALQRDAEAGRAELRELLAARREVAEARHQPVHRRAWFWGVMTVVAAGVGAGIGAAVIVSQKDTRDLRTDLGFVEVPR